MRRNLLGILNEAATGKGGGGGWWGVPASISWSNAASVNVSVYTINSNIIVWYHRGGGYMYIHVHVHCVPILDLIESHCQSHELGTVQY